jgi:uncharacterized protein (TIGR00255 family)
MKSMTGYGKGTVAGDDFSVSVDLKTVNNRFLDIHLRAGSELAALEPVIKKRIERTTQLAYELNRPLIAGYINALKQLQQDFNIGGELDINLLARIPGALQPARNGIDERTTTALHAALDHALDELEKMREQEGATLKLELRDRVQKIEALVPTIEAAADGLAESYRQRLQKRIGELLNRGGQVVELDPARLAQEVAYLADRSDVSEEMVRLRSHLTQFQEALDAPGEAGKMLDFLLQELNREANTTLSKSTDLTIKEAGLAIKAEVEKLREQVQNVE